MSLHTCVLARFSCTAVRAKALQIAKQEVNEPPIFPVPYAISSWNETNETWRLVTEASWPSIFSIMFLLISNLTEQSGNRSEDFIHSRKRNSSLIWWTALLSPAVRACALVIPSGSHTRRNLKKPRSSGDENASVLALLRLLHTIRKPSGYNYLLLLGGASFSDLRKTLTL